MSIVAIVGRPNVGKSTLFNRLIQRREAIVDSVSGVTRDRNYGESDWNGKDFTVIDTGGYLEDSDDVFQSEIDKQVRLAIDEADAIVFVVDVTSGVTSMDAEVANLLRRTDKPVFLAVNKVDNAMREVDAVEFYALGFEVYYTISSSSGSGTGDLLDAVVNVLPKKVIQEIELDEEGNEIVNEIPKFAVVGRPNAGKSSFINAILNEERFVVTSEAGTTRDSIDTRYNLYGFEFDIVDTAGIRRKKKVSEDIEFYSVMRSIRTIESSDVILLMVDANRGFDGQVQNIFWLAQKNNKGVVILVNKWDTIEDKDSNITKKFTEYIKERLEPFTDVPIVFVSATTKQRVYKALETAVQVFKNRSRRIKTKELNDVMLPIFQNTPPPSHKGRYIKVKFCMQLPMPYPVFVFYCNFPQYVKDSYKRFVENKLRELYDFNGVPITVYFRKK